MLLYLLLYLQHYLRTFAPVFFLSILDTTPCVYSVQKKKAPKGERAFISTPWYQYF